MCAVETIFTKFLSWFLGDASAASQRSEREVDGRVRLYVDMEDPDIVFDLRLHNSGQPSQYAVFLG